MNGTPTFYINGVRHDEDYIRDADGGDRKRWGKNEGPMVDRRESMWNDNKFHHDIARYRSAALVDAQSPSQFR